MMKLITRSRLVWMLAAIAALLVGWQYFRYSRARHDSSSCANHFISLRGSLQKIALKHPELILPSTPDACAALCAIWKEGGEGEIGWISGCPESQRRNGSIGYLYVGDGQKLGDVMAKRLPILFCPGENHRGVSEHCHLWITSEGHIICCLSNTAILAELERAVKLAESGEAAYSKRAVLVLKEEIEKRRIR